MQQRPDWNLPENSKRNLDRKLDNAIEETFPTSDPVSVTITKGEAVDYGEESQPPAQEWSGAALNQAKDAVRQATGAAHQAYEQGRRYVERAGSRYPEAQRYYREGGHALLAHARERPLLTILVGAGLGYAIAWALHRGRAERIPDYARTRTVYRRD